MFKFPVKRMAALCLLFLFVVTNVSAQSMTIIGDSEDAKECYYSAQLAIQMQSASRSELAACSNALLTQNLRVRDKAATLINRGIIYVALEDYKLAVKDYERAEKLHPEFGAIHVNRGNLFFLGQSYDSAILEYNKALDIGLSQTYVAHLNRGMAYEKLGQLHKAESDYREAIALAPEWKAAQSKLDRVLGKLN